MMDPTSGEKGAEEIATGRFVGLKSKTPGELIDIPGFHTDAGVKTLGVVSRFTPDHSRSSRFS
jgi:hypothetical protein